MEPVAYHSPVGRPPSRLVWVTVGLAVIAAGVAVGVEVFAGDPQAVNVLDLWAIAPFAALVGVAVWLRRDPSGSAVVLVATAAAAALLAVDVRDFFTSKSSTAALVFVATPVLQLSAAAVAVVVAVTLKLARRASRGTVA